MTVMLMLMTRTMVVMTVECHDDDSDVAAMCV